MSARQGIAEFADCLASVTGRIVSDDRGWRREWNLIGDAELAQADTHLREGMLESACDCWLRALDAYRSATALLRSDGGSDNQLSGKMRICSRQLLINSVPSGELAEIDCFAGAPLEAYFLKPFSVAKRAPAVICISEEGESKDELLCRISAATAGRNYSRLLVEMKDISDARRRHMFGNRVPLEALLGGCVDYLVSRNDVDAKRIGVYGRKSASTYATRLAASDHRIAASVCDGGLWEFSRTLANSNWMNGSLEAPENSDLHGLRARFARRIAGPFLVIAGDEGNCGISEASALYEECRGLEIEMDLRLSESSLTPLGAFEDCIRTNEYIFDWLARKLAPQG